MAQSKEEENRKRRERYAARKLSNGNLVAPEILQQGAVANMNQRMPSIVNNSNFQNTSYDTFLEDFKSKTGLTASWAQNVHGRVLSVFDSRTNQSINTPIRLDTSSPLGVVPIIGGKESDGKIITEGAAYQHTFNQWKTPQGEVGFRVETGTSEFAKAINLSFVRAGTKGYKERTPQDVFNGISADMIRRDEEHLSAASRSGLRVPQGAKERLFGQVRYNLESPGDRFYGGQESIDDLNMMLYGATAPSYIDKPSAEPSIYAKDVAEQNRLKRTLQQQGATFNNGNIVLGQGNYLTYAGGIPEHISPLGLGITGTKKINQATGSQVELQALEAMRDRGGRVTGYRQATPQPIINEANKPLYGIPNIQRPGEERVPAFLSRVAFVETGLAGGMFFQGKGRRVDAHGRTDSVIQKDLESMSPLDLAKADIKFTGKHAAFGHGQYNIATINGETISAQKMREEFYPNPRLQIIELPTLRHGNEWSKDPNKGESTDPLAQELRDKGHLVRQVFGLEYPRLIQEGTTLNSYRVKGSMGALKGTLTPTGASLDNEADMLGFEMKNARGFEGIWSAMTNKQQQGLVGIWAEGEGERGQKVLADLNAQIGDGSGVGTSTEQLAGVGGYRGGSVEFLSSVFKMVSASKGDEAMQQRIAQTAGFSYKQSGVYDLGPWSKEHYRSARSDYVAVRTAKGMTTKEALRQFHKTYKYGNKGTEQNILQMNVDYPHLVAMTAHSRVGDPSSSGNLSGLFLNELHRKYPEFAKNVTGRGMTNDQMAGAGLLRYVMDQTDANRGKAVAARVVSDDEARQIQAINTGRDAGGELKGAEFAKAVADILPDVGIGDTMDVNGTLFPSPLAIAGKQYQTEENEYGPANKYQRALNMNLEEQLLPEEERLAQRRYATENNQRTKAQWSAEDMFRDIGQSKETLIKDLKSVKTAGASWAATFFAPFLGIMQQTSGRNLIVEDAKAIARQTGAKFKDVFSSLTKNVTGFLAMRQIGITPGSEVPEKLALGNLNISKERERVISRDLADQFDKRATGSASVFTDTKDWDLDPESIMRHFVNMGNGIVKFGRGLALHGKEAAKYLKNATQEMFTPKLQRELISSQKSMADAIGQPDIVKKLVDKATRVPTRDALQTTSDASVTGMTSANAWYMASADVSANAILRGEETTRARTAAYYDLGIDNPQLGSSDLASMFSSARVTTDEEGNLRLNYSTSKKISEEGGARQTNQLALGGKGTGNAGVFGVRQFVRRMAVDATTPFNGEVIARPEHIANMFSRNKKDEQELLSVLRTTDSSKWGSVLTGRINASYTNQYDEDAKQRDAEWLQAPGPASLLAIAIRKNRSGDVVNDQNPSVTVPNGVQKFVTSLAEMVSGGTNKKSRGMVNTFNNIAKHLAWSRNEKGVTGEGNKLGTNDAWDLFEGPAGNIDNAEKLAMERIGLFPRGNSSLDDTEVRSANDVPETSSTRALRLESELSNPNTSIERQEAIKQELGPIHEKLYPSSGANIPQVPNVTNARPPSQNPPHIPGVTTKKKWMEGGEFIRQFDKEGNLIAQSPFEDWRKMLSGVPGLAGGGSATGAGETRSRKAGQGSDLGRPSVKQRNYATFNDRQMRIAQVAFTGPFAARNALAQEGMDNIVNRIEALGIAIPQAGGRNNIEAIPQILRSMLESGDPDKVTQARSIIADNENLAKAGQLIEERAANAIYAESNPSANSTVSPIMESGGYFTSSAYRRDLALGEIAQMAIPGTKKQREAINEKRLKETQGRSAQLSIGLTLGGLIGENVVSEQEWKARVGQIPKEEMAEMKMIANRTKSGLDQRQDVTEDQKQVLAFMREVKRVSPESLKEAGAESLSGPIADRIQQLQREKEALEATTKASATFTDGLSENEKKLRAINIEQGTLAKALEKESLEKEKAQILQEGITTKNRPRLETISSDLEAIYKAEDKTKKPFNLAEFGRDIFGGWGLMYARSIAGFATAGIGQGAEENLQMRQKQAQARYNVLGTAQAPYDQNMALQNLTAVNGANANALTGLKMWAVQNRGISEIGQLGIAGASAAAYSGFLVRDTPWGRLQADPKTATYGTTGLTKGMNGLAQLDLAIFGTTMVANVLGEGYSRSQDPVGLGLRQGRSGFSVYDRAATVMSSMGGGENWQQVKKYQALSSWIAGGGQETPTLGQQARDWIWQKPTTEYFNYTSSDWARGYGENIQKQYPQLPAEVAGQLGAMETKFGWNLSKYNLGSTDNMMGAYANDLRMGGNNIQTGTLMANSGGQGTAWAQQQMTISNPSTGALDPRFGAGGIGNGGNAYEIGQAGFLSPNRKGMFGYDPLVPDGGYKLADGTILDKNGFALGDPNAQTTQSRQTSMELLGAGAVTNGLITADENVLAQAALKVILALNPRAMAQYGVTNLPTTQEGFAETAKGLGSFLGGMDAAKVEQFTTTANALGSLTPAQMAKYGGVWKTEEEIAAMSPEQMRSWNIESGAVVSAADRASSGIKKLSENARYYQNPELAGKIETGMAGLSGGQQDFYQSAMTLDPMSLAILAQSGKVNLGSLPAATTVQGVSISANALAMADVAPNGRVTGMPWSTSTMQLGNLSSQEVGQDIFGSMNNQYTQAAVNGYQLPQPITLPGQTNADGSPVQVTQVSGVTAIQWQAQDTSWMYQQQGFALQQQSIDSSWAHTQASFAIQEKQFELSSWYQKQQFALQQTQINQSRENIATGNAIQQKQMDFTQAWAKEDWQFQDMTRNMQWGWKQEDFADESRFLTGRARKKADRQMERDTTMHNLEEDQIDKQRARQEELWKLEDERFELQKKQQRESLEMQQKQLDLQKKYFAEQQKLQQQQMAEDRKYAAEQHKQQQQQLDLQRKQAEAQRQEQLVMRQIQLAIQAMSSSLGTLSGEGMQKLHSGLQLVLDDINAIYATASANVPVTTNAPTTNAPTTTHAMNYSSTHTENAYQDSTTAYFFKGNKSEKQQIINVYVGNEHLSKFVLNAVSEELRS